MATIPKLPAIPSVPADAAPELQQFLNAAKSVLDNLTGGGGLAYVTQDDLEVFAGKVPSLAEAGSSLSQPTVGAGQGGAPPPALTGLKATAGFAYVVLEWDTLPYGNAAYTIIYRATVDDFSQAEPIGTSRYLIYSDYVPNYQEYYYWISSVSDDGVEGPPNQQEGTKSASAIDTQFLLDQIDKALTDDQIANGGIGSEGVFGTAVIGTAAIKTAAIIDAHIQSLGADKVVASSLSAFTANLGDVQAGRMRSPDNTFLIDLDQKVITIAGPNGKAYDTYTEIKNGYIETWYWNGYTHALAKSLTHIETGTADNNTWVVIPGVFLTAPKVMVSPAGLQCYNASYPSQNQTLKCIAQSLQETTPGSKQWQFKAVAQLELGAATVTTPVNYYPSASSSNTLQSPAYTTPSNTTSVWLNLRARSQRGTGAAPNYYARKVYFQVYARPSGSGGGYSLYYSGSWINLPQDIDSNNTLFCGFTATMPYAGAWQFYVVANYADTGGTFSVSGSSYEYATDTITGAQYNITQTIDKQMTANGTTSESKVVKAPLPAYTPPSGWTVYSVTYAYKYFSYVALNGFPDYYACGTGGYCGYSGSAKALSKLPARSISIANGNQAFGSTTPTSAPNQTTSTYDQNFLTGTIEVSGYRPAGYSYVPRMQAQGGFSDITVSINRSKPITNSTTPVNVLQFFDYTSTISGTSVLATGTLNWQAVG